MSADDSGKEALDELRADLVDGMRFVHVLAMQTKLDAVDSANRLMALTEELIAQGALDLRRLEERRARLAKSELQRQETQSNVLVDATVDKYALTDLPVIDCDSRMHLCKARCCKLQFPLSFQDLDEGLVRWNYGAPYRIRQDPQTGYCVHNEAGTHQCGLHAHRPSVCRRYDCRNDRRIWVDFDKQIPVPVDSPLQGDAHPAVGEPTTK